MSDPGDVPGDMTGAPAPDDRTAERLLRGRAVDGHPDLAAFVTGLNELRADPPEPRGELVRLLAHGADPSSAGTADVPPWPPLRRRSWRRTAARVGRLSVAAKVLLGSAVAVAGMTSAAGAGVLPAPVQNGVAEVVRTITPFEIPTSPPTPAAPDDDPAPPAPRSDDVVPRSEPQPSAVDTSPQPRTEASPTSVPSAVPTPTSTPTPTPVPTPTPSKSPLPESATDAPSPTGSPTGEAAGVAEPVKAAPSPRANGGPKPSRSPGGGGGRPTEPPPER